MSDFDFLTLFPEKFRSSPLLIELLRTLSDRLQDVSQTDILIAGVTQAALTDSSSIVTLNEDNLIQRDA